jgi:tRNA threonylcarbamoyl adenosine modification protein (Sua5/YciO/YrdC/YwlC family)
MATEVVDIFAAPDYSREVDRAASLLREGGIVVLPTETVYGAAGALTKHKSVERLKQLRGGDAKPLTIHLARPHEAEKFLGPINDYGRRLMSKLWPGPVGLMFEVPADRRAAVAGELGVSESEIYHGSTITLRCPDHIVTSDVIGRAQTTVVLIRAGGDETYHAAKLAGELEGKVDLILDAGPARFSKVSTLLRVHDDRYEIVRAGIYDERIIERLLRTTVLFVCSGNTCRSPMAEAIARRIIADRLNVHPDDLEKRGISVISAGSFALPGAKATPAAVEAVKALGGDLSKHRSRPLSVELIHQADVIFTMSRNHANAVTALVPAASEKTKTLDPDQDIEDPIGGDESLYRELAAQLRGLIEKRLESLPLT